MRKIFVDTDILIDYSKGHSRYLEELLQLQTEGKAELFINPVVVAEFFSDQKLEKKDKEQQAEEFFGQFALIEISKRMGFIAGALLRKQSAGYLGDAMIAATCLSGECVLATRNNRHFARVPRLLFY